MITFTKQAVQLILSKAVNLESWSVLSTIMNSLAGQYIEGLDDEAGSLFNETWANLPLTARNIIVNEMVFESAANKLAEKSGLDLPYKKVGQFKYEYVGFLQDPRWYAKQLAKQYKQ